MLVDHGPEPPARSILDQLVAGIGSPLL